MFDTPFSWTKQIASHLGGTRQGMAVSWPGHIKDPGGIRNQFHHVIDVVPTILEVGGIQQPEYVDGIKQSPIEGVSFAYTFDQANANAPSRHKTQYFEMMGDHAIYHEGWMASTKVIRPPWVALGQVNPDPRRRIRRASCGVGKDGCFFSPSSPAADGGQVSQESYLPSVSKRPSPCYNAIGGADARAPRGYAPVLRRGRRTFAERAILGPERAISNIA